MINLIFTLIFLAQPQLPFDMLGSTNYHERERAIFYLSRKDYLNENKLFQLYRKSPDEEVRKNALRVIENRYSIKEDYTYPAMCFMSLSVETTSDVCSQKLMINTNGPLSRTVRDYLVDEYYAIDYEFIPIEMQRKITAKFIHDMRFKRGINRKVLDLWIEAARIYEYNFVKENAYQLLGCPE